MVLANLYLLGWNYEKWKYILPFNRPTTDFTNQENLVSDVQTQDGADRRPVSSRYEIRSLYARFRIFLKQLFSDKFPTLFFAGVFAAVIFFMLVVPKLYDVKPRNTLIQCQKQFKDGSRTTAGNKFCNCIHQNGEPLDKCLNEYNNAPEDDSRTP